MPTDYDIVGFIVRIELAEEAYEKLFPRRPEIIMSDLNRARRCIESREFGLVKFSIGQAEKWTARMMATNSLELATGVPHQTYEANYKVGGISSV